jgi:hypothetical protein
MSGSQRADLWRGRASPLSAMDLPPILSDFADELAGQGFVVTDARYDAQAYGNGLVEFAAGPGQHLRFV